MIQEAFRLEGKVAIVTGCDTGLGQGMAVALAEAGCDVVGVNRKIPHETAEKINALGLERRNRTLDEQSRTVTQLFDMNFIILHQ